MTGANLDYWCTKADKKYRFNIILHRSSGILLGFFLTTILLEIIGIFWLSEWLPLREEFKALVLIYIFISFVIAIMWFISIQNLKEAQQPKQSQALKTMNWIIPISSGFITLLIRFFYLLGFSHSL